MATNSCPGQHTDDVVVAGPEPYVGGVQDSKKREAPVDTVDDGLLSILKELVNDCSQK